MFIIISITFSFAVSGLILPAFGAGLTAGAGFFPGLNGFSFGFSVGFVVGLVAGFAGAGAVACSLVSRFFVGPGFG
jgi:hypothetical protein